MYKSSRPGHQREHSKPCTAGKQKENSESVQCSPPCLFCGILPNVSHFLEYPTQYFDPASLISNPPVVSNIARSLKSYLCLTIRELPYTILLELIPWGLPNEVFVLHVNLQSTTEQPANASPFPASFPATPSERAPHCQLIRSILHNYLSLNCCHFLLLFLKKILLPHLT